MANNFTSNPIVLDGVMASPYSTLFTTNNLLIYPRYIEWDNPTAAGNQLIILDAASRVLFEATASAARVGGYFEIATGVRWPSSWQLTTLTSGVVLIWYTT